MHPRPSRPTAGPLRNGVQVGDGVVAAGVEELFVEGLHDRVVLEPAQLAYPRQVAAQGVDTEDAAQANVGHPQLLAGQHELAADRVQSHAAVDGPGVAVASAHSAGPPGVCRPTISAATSCSLRLLRCEARRRMSKASSAETPSCAMRMPLA